MTFELVEQEIVIEDSELQEMKEHAEQSSLGAKRAYINALEYTIKQRKVRIKELEEKQRWIDEVARPTHPEDERPWCSAYLDCRARIKELEESSTIRILEYAKKAYFLMKEEAVWNLKEREKLEIRVLKLEEQLESSNQIRKAEKEILIKEIERVRELEDRVELSRTFECRLE